jgi:hypothetical protein
LYCLFRPNAQAKSTADQGNEFSLLLESQECGVMSRKMVPVMSVWRWISALCSTAILILLLGCATTPPIVTTPPIAEMAWVRTDGRKIADDPTLLQQGKSDIAACDANLDSGTPTASARGCMAQKGYVLVRRDQAEDVRAAYAAGAQRAAPNR